MTRIVAAIALTLALAAPAAAETVARRTPAVGPGLAGDLVAWGEEAHNGAVRVVVGAPGREPILAYRIRPATARRTERGFFATPAAFAASATTFAAVVSTGTVTSSGTDFTGIEVTQAAVGSPLRGPAAILSGAIPARGDARCRGEIQYPEAVDVDGDRIVVGDSVAACGPTGAPAQDRVLVRGPGVNLTLRTGTGGDIRDVALTADHLAWVRDGDRDEVVVRSFVSGADVVRLTERDLHATHIDEVALQADGSVAISYGDLTGQRLAWAAPGQPGVRVLDRHMGSRGLALAAGRVLYARSSGALVLRPLSGGPVRRLAQFRPGHRQVGDLDLDATRATWATHAPHGPARIVVRGL